MNNVLNNILEEQQLSIVESIDANKTETMSLIVFGNSNSHFYTEIKNIKIVITNEYIIPYPVPTPGHIGLIAERGQIIPLINSPLIKDENDSRQSKIVIFEDDSTEKLFGIEVSYLKKEDVSCKLYETVENSDQKILTINSQAYYHYNPYEYFKQTA